MCDCVERVPFDGHFNPEQVENVTMNLIRMRILPPTELLSHVHSMLPPAGEVSPTERLAG